MGDESLSDPTLQTIKASGQPDLFIHSKEMIRQRNAWECKEDDLGEN